MPAASCASAVSAAGGLGLIGGGYGDARWIDEQWALVGDNRVGVGVITWASSMAVVHHVVAKRPAAVWLSFGDPAEAIWAIHAAGCVSICQVSSLEEAQTAVRAGANVLVAQGSDAGGHGPNDVALPALVSSISRVLPNVPLVAAGGLNDRFDYERMRSLECRGGCAGHGVLLTTEALDVPAAKQQLIASTADDTIRSTVYDIVRGPEWPSPYSGRSVQTDVTRRWRNDVDEAPTLARFGAG
ncbi:MAG: nitronate monooxygenase [Acidimicrobiales bacterium]